MLPPTDDLLTEGHCNAVFTAGGYQYHNSCTMFLLKLVFECLG